MLRIVASLSAVALSVSAEQVGVSLNLKSAAEQAALDKVYDHYLNEFVQYHAGDHEKLLQDVQSGMKSFLTSKAATAYKTVPSQPHCDRGTPAPAATAALSARGVSAFPGGVLKRMFGFDLGKFLYEQASKAAGPAAASGGMGGILAMQALATGAGMLQAGVSAAVDIIPPLVTGNPLTCAPMVTGHNCFGAVLYPITMADFVIADVSDSMLDGYIAGFPNTYATKVGKTSDAQYKACFGAAMSMQCGSIFPRCAAPASRSEPSPVGRMPLCFTSCISTLVMCPGFWLDDVQSACHSVSAPPMCTMATYWNMWRLPPQYVNYEDSHATPLECPSNAALSATDASSDYNLFDAETIGQSPIDAAAAAGSARVPLA